MKILMVNKFFHIVGGSERYFFDLCELLQSHGHEVVPFSMKDQDNYETSYKHHFVSNINYDCDSLRYRLKNSPRIIGKMIYSLESRRKIENLIKQTNPDIAHIHMIDHQISPSILDSFAKYKIPIVQTLHEYKLICPNYRLYRDRDNKICEKCKGGRYYQAIRYRCLKGSYLGSLLACLAMYIHKMKKIYEKNVDLFIAPSKFLQNKMKEFGIDNRKITYLPNFVKDDESAPHYGYRNYFVYMGRISAEKGIQTLIEAMKKIPSSVKLFVLGRGPLEKYYKQYAQEKNVRNIEFLGFASGEKLKSIIKNAMCIVIPSEWYENCPMVVLEALVWGKPTIGSALGGIPDLIDEEQTGLLFEPGNSDHLAEKMKRVIENPDLILKLGETARKRFENEYNPEIHYHRIIHIYKRVIGC